MTYEIYAIRHARAERARADCFIGGDPRTDTVEMAYYLWLVRGRGREIVVDTGFSADEAARRGREHLICPGDALRRLGTDPDTVETVVTTHLHYDHAGNHALFPRARFHLQEAEMAHATGPYMAHPHLRAGYGAEDVAAMVARVHAGRVAFHAGDAPLAPGIGLMLIGGHAAGLQALRVETARGPVVVASDAAVFTEGLVTGRPFPAAFHVGAEVAGYARLLEAAGGPDAVIPGHDADVMRRYPAAVEGVAWRVDLPPAAP